MHSYEDWFDFTDGVGKFGYALWEFEDKIRASYDGTAKAATAKGTKISAEFHSFTGSGRFQGVSIEGGSRVVASRWARRDGYLKAS